MSFEQCTQQLGPPFLNISADQETATVKFVGEPVARSQQFDNRASTRYCFPVLTDEGLKTWATSATNFKLLRDNWPKFDGQWRTITRHGVPGDRDTKYVYGVHDPSDAQKAAGKALKSQDIANFQARVERHGVQQDGKTAEETIDQIPF